VNVIGYVRAEVGVGEAARLLVAALRAAGVPYAVVPCAHPTSREEHDFQDVGTGSPIYDTNIICVNADQLPRFVEAVGPGLVEGRYTIGLWMWEVERFPAYMAHAAALLDEVWVASGHAAAAIRPAVAKPVITFPLPVVEPRPPALSRADLGLPEGYLFLFCFDFHSVAARKNPIGLVQAFTRAFPSVTDARLVIKTMHGDAHRSDLEALRRSADLGRADIQVIDDYLPRDIQLAVLNACDAYVSLHRAEGFGLTPAEAMALGKPVIATAYSGNLEFMNESNSFLVPFRLVPVPPGTDPYPSEARWADPDIDAAARLMRHVYTNRAEAQRKGARARDDMVRLHAPDSRAEFLRRRFLATRLPTLRHARTVAERARSLASGATGGSAGRPRAGLMRRLVSPVLRPLLAHLDAKWGPELGFVSDWSDRVARYIDSRLGGSLGPLSEELRSQDRRLAALEARLETLTREPTDERSTGAGVEGASVKDGEVR
jgi:glycosyltransferase involved in cell wall biosynthesis